MRVLPTATGAWATRCCGKIIGKAIRELRRALDLEPGDISSLYSLARTLTAQGQAPEAAGLYRSVHRAEQRRTEENISRTTNNSSIELAHKGDVAAAAASLERAIEMDPSDGIAHYNYGVVQFIAGRADEAIDQFQMALRLNGGQPNAYYHLGRALLAVGRVKEAVEPLRKAVRRMPRDARAHNALGIALARAGDVARAVPEVSAALSSDPENPAFEDNLNCIQHRPAGCILVA